MSRLRGFETVLRSRFLRDGAMDAVRLPLADPEGKWIRVDAAARRSQFNREATLFGEAPWFYAPVAGSRGWRSVEAAYMLSRFEPLDRSLFEAEQFRNVVKHLVGAALFAGAGNTATGPLKPHRNRVEALFADFDPRTTVAVAFTRGDAHSQNQPSLPEGLKPAHTYAVIAVRKDAAGKILSLKLADPHDTDAPRNVTMDSLLSNFSGIEAATPASFAHPHSDPSHAPSMGSAPPSGT